MLATLSRVHDEVVCGLVTGSEAAVIGLAGALCGRAVGEYTHVEAIIPEGLPAVRREFEKAGYRLNDELQQSLLIRVM